LYCAVFQSYFRNPISVANLSKDVVVEAHDIPHKQSALCKTLYITALFLI
jgi:hypothetical protein